MGTLLGRGGLDTVVSRAQIPVREGAMFCCSCGSEFWSSANCFTHRGHQISDAIEHNSRDSVDAGELIKEYYFHQGHPYVAIVGFFGKTKWGLNARLNSEKEA